MRTRLDCARLDSQQLGRLLFREILEVAQDEHGALVWRKSGERRPHVDGSVEVNVGRLALGDVSHWPFTGARCDAHRLSHRDAPNPRPQRSRLTQRGQVSQDDDQCLLGGVVATVEGDRATDSADPWHQLANQGAHRHRIAPLRSADAIFHVNRE